MSNVIAIIGLGYVGLPIAARFGRKIKTIGFDISNEKINFLKSFKDPNNEISKKELKNSKNLCFTSNEKDISKANYFIVTVPTPLVSYSNKPDFGPLKKACKIIGQNMNKSSIVIFESTVYPGATRDICIPVLEKYSKKKWLKDFNVGYSPERINVGDKSKIFTKVFKLISGDTSQSLNKIEKIYKLITKKLFKVKSIEIAEAAKSLENTQRDINIAFINEFSKICENLNIKTADVIKAASSKWNFVKYTPGLVGGHCISVDPYYLSYKAKSLNYNPNIINYSRKINESMPSFIFKKIKKNLKLNKKKNSVLILGVTFKENCSDIRNSKIFELVRILKKNNFSVQLHDTYASKKEVKKIYGENLINLKNLRKKNDVLLLNSPHSYYLKNLNKFLKTINENGIFFDIKSAMNDRYSNKKIKYLSL